MSSKDGYEDFQDAIFQDIQDREDAESNDERRMMRFAIKYGNTLGLPESEVRALYKDGMSWGEMLAAIRAIRQK
ncbi:hypothetical protein [Candidatus Korobacter versatilis]|uniref:hypothetical protein n=1 Tax=Candidatus Korobacter versatilis TaxID=658062 RepID=UPI0002D61292|nr:hypothetical protein [Candidatus Koribacter versatilis]